jgi:hypothetical protein
MAFLVWDQEQTKELLRKLSALKKTFKGSKKPPFGIKTFKRLGRHTSTPADRQNLTSA